MSDLQLSSTNDSTGLSPSGKDKRKKYIFLSRVLPTETGGIVTGLGDSFSVCPDHYLIPA